MQNPTPLTLGNMRANGVRTLAVWCGGRGCVTVLLTFNFLGRGKLIKKGRSHPHESAAPISLDAPPAPRSGPIFLR
jgi:hypothetical protein